MSHLTPQKEAFMKEFQVWLLWICFMFGVAFIGLGSKPFWVDESIAVLPVQSIHETGWPLSPFDLDFMPWQVEDGLWDPATPLYRYAVAAFTALFGFSEFTTRSFSILLGGLSFLPLYGLLKRCFSPLFAIRVLGILASSTTFLGFIREARHFTLILLTSTACLYFLYRALHENHLRSKAWWPVCLWACLLSHAVGYLLLPVLLSYLYFNRSRSTESRLSLWDRQYRKLYWALGMSFSGIFLYYSSSLPFFHEVNCSNRFGGCQTNPLFYGVVLYAFNTSVSFQTMHLAQIPLPYGFALFLMGARVLYFRFKGGQMSLAKEGVLVCWIVVPLILLSIRELKFPRYLFMYGMPMCAVLSVLGAERVAQWKIFERLKWKQHQVLPVILIVLILAPQIAITKAPDGTEQRSLHSSLLRYAWEELWKAPQDNWEKIHAQAEYLKQHAAPTDTIVTTFDDASLGYYLKRPIHGFLNSQHTDAFFLELLTEVHQNNRKLWLVDTLKSHNYCLESPEKVKKIDCKVKYSGFYQACLQESEKRSVLLSDVPFDSAQGDSELVDQGGLEEASQQELEAKLGKAGCHILQVH